MTEHTKGSQTIERDYTMEVIAALLQIIEDERLVLNYEIQADEHAHLAKTINDRGDTRYREKFLKEAARQEARASAIKITVERALAIIRKAEGK